MSFSFRNIFSDDPDFGGGAGGQGAEVFSVSDHASSGRSGGLSQDSSAPSGPHQAFLASELLAYIPKAIAAPSGIPMGKEILVPVPSDGSLDVKLSTLYQLCPELFAAEITPLNDSIVTLPPRLGATLGTSTSISKQGKGFSSISPANETPGNPFWSPLSSHDESSPAFEKGASGTPGGLNFESMVNFPDDSAGIKNPFSMPKDSASSMKEAHESDTESAATSFPESDFGSIFSKPDSSLSSHDTSDLADSFAPLSPFENEGGFSTLFSTQASSDASIPFPEPPSAELPAASDDTLDHEPPGVWGAMFGGSVFGEEQTSEKIEHSNPAEAAFDSIGNLLKQGGLPTSEHLAPSSSFASASPDGETPTSKSSDTGLYESFGDSSFPSAFGNDFEADSSDSKSAIFESFGAPFAPPAKTVEPTTHEEAPAAGFTPPFAPPTKADVVAPEETPSADFTPPFAPPTKADVVAPEETKSEGFTPAFTAPVEAEALVAEEAPSEGFTPPFTPESNEDEPVQSLSEAKVTEPTSTTNEESAPSPLDQVVAFATGEPASPSEPTATEDAPPATAWSAPAPKPETSTASEDASPATAWATPAPKPETSTASEETSPAAAWSTPAPKPEAAAASEEAPLPEPEPASSELQKPVGKISEPAPEPPSQKSSPSTPEPAPEISTWEFNDHSYTEAVSPLAPSSEVSDEESEDLRYLELRAIFSTNENFTFSKVARKVISLPGINSCSLSSPTKLVQASRREESRLGNEAREMVSTLRNLAKLTGLPGARTFTLQTDRGIISLFLEGEYCVTVHQEGSTLAPGVREKLILIARSLAKLRE